MRSTERLRTLADLADSQWGLFTTAQAGEAGVSVSDLKRFTDQRILVRLRHGVYRLAGVPPAAEDPIRAEWLALEPKRRAGDRLTDPVPTGVVADRSAARLHELGDLDADRHEFAVPRRRASRSPDVTFRVAQLESTDWQLVAGLPVTTPVHTITDLAAAHTDGGHLATVVRDAIRAGQATRAEIATALRPYTHHYGLPVGTGDELVAAFIEQAGIPESAVALTRTTQPNSAVEQALLDALAAVRRENNS
ncbi:type IV toxin-antitoxin system AbiEi family antitoxin domain-containing protein [Nocardia sp. NPDC058640]|uniref:type IV toxin-antitoxin system AbiEi family antitoxin domain-containing protein n=1 Tax=Nocardia sp. NPDC058640 TaxID=3346571 RepID=UPI0036540F2B